MSGPVLLYLAVGAIALFPVIAAVALVGRDPRRAAVAVTLSHVEQDYGKLHDPSVPRSFSERVVLPLLRRFGGLGRALSPQGTLARIQRLLDRAGNPPGWPAERVVAAKGVGLLVGAAVAGLTGLAVFGLGLTPLAAVLGAVLGFFVPDVTIYNVGVKRQDSLRRTLPDVLDTLTVCVEAGQGFDAALAQVVRNGKGPLAGEMSRVLQEMRIGRSRVEALRAFAGRTTVPELRGFATAVIQASELGVPVAQVLREQAREMRLKRRQWAEEKAQKVPIKILFPTLFCLFPSLFIVILGPGVIKIIAAFST
jgi:tight adherence protein C